MTGDDDIEIPNPGRADGGSGRRRGHAQGSPRSTTTPDKDTERTKAAEPAPWALYALPAPTNDVRTNLVSFVDWYNATYVGAEGRTQRIPPCWQQHPGLLQEIGTLAASWRAANVGASANPRDAQQWHHQWRPGFAARVRDWVHPHCLDGDHQTAGAPARPDRFAARAHSAGADANTAEKHRREESSAYEKP